MSDQSGLGAAQEKLRYGASLQSAQVVSELLVAMETLLHPAAIGAQDSAGVLGGPSRVAQGQCGGGMRVLGVGSAAGR